MLSCLSTPLADLLSKDICSILNGNGSEYSFLACGVSKTHPLKNPQRNEDAFIVSKQVIGVADGVGGIADEIPGVNPSHLPRELMERCKQISFLRQLDPQAFEHEMKEILRRWGIEYDEEEWTSFVLIRSWLDCQHWGATTALLVSIEDGVMSAAQYGDSCFMLLRKRGKSQKAGWKIMYRSPPQCHTFSCPHQLTRKPLKGMQDYTAADVQWDADLIFTPPRMQLKLGDLIIAGSDGLFDNLFDAEILSLAGSHGPMPSRSPEELANVLWAKAVEFGASKEKCTPWAQATHKEFGAPPKGGKPDDITVVVAHVVHEDEADGFAITGASNDMVSLRK